MIISKEAALEKSRVIVVDQCVKFHTLQFYTVYFRKVGHSLSWTVFLGPSVLNIKVGHPQTKQYFIDQDMILTIFLSFFISFCRFGAWQVLKQPMQHLRPQRGTLTTLNHFIRLVGVGPGHWRGPIVTCHNRWSGKSLMRNWMRKRRVSVFIIIIHL